MCQFSRHPVRVFQIYRDIRETGLALGWSDRHLPAKLVIGGIDASPQLNRQLVGRTETQSYRPITAVVDR